MTSTTTSPTTWTTADGALSLEPDAILSPLGRVTAAALAASTPHHPLRLSHTTPMLDALWATALDDVERNIVDCAGRRYFGAGTHWGARVYTRDIAFAGVLGCNRLWPELMFMSLDHTREVRWKVGFQVEQGYHDLAGFDHIPWQRVNCTSTEFMAQHHTNSYARRTDDVIWLWAAADLIRSSGGDRARWQWLRDWGDKFFERFYKPFFDPSDGLYRGQATFCDIHFPGKCSSGYPQEWSIADCLHCKPLGTNSLYVLGMAAMAEACEALGEIDAAADWSQQRQHLIDAITSELRREDGTLAYYKRGDGQLEERRDALGTGLAIIAGVVTGDEAATLITSYPRHWWGAPMYEPFFPFANSYHNRTSWPFVDAVFLWAEAIATGRDTAPEQAAWLARAIHPAKGGFAEVAQPDGTPFGSGHQLWSAAGFINAALRGGWVCA